MTRLNKCLVGAFLVASSSRTSQAFTGGGAHHHGVSHSHPLQRESNSDSRIFFSSKPDNDESSRHFLHGRDFNNHTSDLQTSNDILQQQRVSVEKKAEKRVEKSIDLLSLEQKAEAYAERLTERKSERSVEESVQDEFRHGGLDETINLEKESSLDPSSSSQERNDTAASNIDDDFPSTISTSALNQNDGRHLTPEQLRSMEIAAERQVEQQTMQSVEQSAEISMEKMMEERIEQQGHVPSRGNTFTSAPTKRVYSHLLGSTTTSTTTTSTTTTITSTTTKSTWNASSYRSNVDISQESSSKELTSATAEAKEDGLASSEQTNQSNNFLVGGDDVSRKGQEASNSGIDFSKHMDGYQVAHGIDKTALEKTADDSHLKQNPLNTSTNESMTDTEESNLSNSLNSLSLNKGISITDLESAVEKMVESSIEIKAIEKAAEEMAEKLIQSSQLQKEESTVDFIIEERKLTVDKVPSKTFKLEQEKFHRRLLEARFKINLLDRQRQAVKKGTQAQDVEKDAAGKVFESVPFSATVNKVSYLEFPGEVDLAVDESATKVSQFEREKFQRRLLEARIKIDLLDRQRRTEKRESAAVLTAVDLKTGDNDNEVSYHEILGDGVDLAADKVTTKISKLEQEKFQRRLLEARFKIDLLDRQRQTVQKDIEAQVVENVSLPITVDLKTRDSGEEMACLEIPHEVELAVDESAIERRSQLKQENSQRRLLEARFKINMLDRQRRAAKKAFMTHRKLLEARLYLEAISRQTIHESVQANGSPKSPELHTQSAFISESRLDIDLHSDKNQRELQTKRRRQESITPKIGLRDTKVRQEKPETPKHLKIKKKSKEDSAIMHRFASEAETLANKLIEQGKSIVSKFSEAREATTQSIKQPPVKKDKTVAAGFVNNKKQRADILEVSQKQRLSFLSKLGLMDEEDQGSRRMSAPTTKNSASKKTNTKKEDQSRRTKENKSLELGREKQTFQLNTIKARELAVVKARQQPKSKREEKALQKKYGRLEPKERAYRILLDLGMIIEHPDPDSPNYDHSFDHEYVPSGEWV